MCHIPELKHLFIYTTWKCNLHCKHCWVGYNTNSYSSLTIDDLNNVIEQAIVLGLQHIKISGGEPLLTKDITQFIIRKAKMNDIEINIETNGTLLDENWADYLAVHNVAVSISIDSSNENIHDNFRGMKGAFKASTRSLDLLYERGTPAGVVMSISTPDYNAIERMIQLCTFHHASFLKINPIVNTGKAKQGQQDYPFSLLPVEMIRISSRYCRPGMYKIPVILMLPFGLSIYCHLLDKDSVSIHCGKCPTLNLMSILPNGDFGLCADAELHKALHFGNVYENDLLSTWKSNSALLSMRKMIPDALNGVCSNCMSKTYCQGSCRVLALLDGGELTSPHPICRKLYDENKFPLINKSVEK